MDVIYLSGRGIDVDLLIFVGVKLMGFLVFSLKYWGYFLVMVVYLK